MSILKIKDSQGNWVGVPTIKGDTGNGISSAILNDDYTLTLTFTDGTTYKTPSIRGEKGEKGEPATDMEIHICSASEYDAETRIPTIANPNDKTFYLVPTEDGASPDLFTEWVYVNGAWEMFGSAKIDLSGYLTDVQINGTSIVEDGVANVPINTGRGITFTNGTFAVVNAAVSDIKNGVGIYRPITSSQQDLSTFYGLAKASGDTTQSQSSNAVGTYTDNAKDKIQNMLGITPLIASHETDPFESNHVIGELFIIGGKLYRAKTVLTAGEYVNEGTNVEVVNVTEVLGDYATKQEIENNINIIEKNNSGSIVSFEDGADDIPLKSLVVDINPVQDLHGQESPYPAGGGKNKSPLEHLDNVTWGTTSGLSDLLAVFNALPAGDYTISCKNTLTAVTGTGSWQFGFYLSGNTNKEMRETINTDPQTGTVYTLAKTITIYSADVGKFTNLYVYGCGASGVGAKGTANLYDIQLESGSTATDFAPYENICPISGWTSVDVEQSGVNVFDKATAVQDAYINDGNGVEKVSTGSVCSDYISVVPNTTYYIKSDQTMGAWGAWYDADKIYISGITGYVASAQDSAKTKTAPSNARYMRLTIIRSGTGNVDTFSVNYPSTDHSYHPYTGRSITIDLGQTVYGAKLYPLEGKAIINMAMVDLGTLTWNYIASNKIFSTNIIAKKPSITEGAVSHYANGYWWGGWADKDCVWCGNMANGGFVVKDTRFADAATFKSAMSGVQFCYELAEPIEIQLTPQEVNSLLGANNIWADTGDTEVAYFSQVDEDLVDYIKANLNSYAKKDLLNNYVDDIQIDGTSIVENGIANIPIASAEKIGAVKIYSANGVYIDNNHDLTINRATDSQVKNGGASYRPIVPINQHISTFYGLAKAAGHDEKDSTLPVGTYTDEAKFAIKQMLSIADNYDSFIVNVEGTDPTITGQPSYRYNCGEVLSLTVTPPETGTIDFRFTSGSSPTVLTLPSTVKMPEWWVEVEANTIYEMCITDGVYCGVMSWAM